MNDINQLSRNSFLLECLESCGVDNWKGYDDAIRDFNESFNEEE